jgi:hypothetical protein
VRGGAEICTAALTDRSGVAPDVQLTFATVQRTRSRSSRGPTTTVCCAGRSSSTYSGSDALRREALALTHREAMDAIVPSQDLAAGIRDHAGRRKPPANAARRIARNHRRARSRSPGYPACRRPGVHDRARIHAPRSWSGRRRGNARSGAGPASTRRGSTTDPSWNRDRGGGDAGRFEHRRQAVRSVRYRRSSIRILLHDRPASRT